MTIRSIAAACGVGTGTVYNYFASKEQLVASFMLADWQVSLERMNAEAADALMPCDALYAIYAGLRGYVEKNAAIFRDRDAVAGFTGSFSKYHALLRSQIAAPLMRFCPDAFTADFVAESLLVWTVNGKEFEELAAVLGKII